MYEIESTRTGIARDQLGIDTLVTRKSDELDFYDVAVWQVRNALAAAYDAGHARASRELVASANHQPLTSPEMAAVLDLARLSIEMARNWLLPLRAPVAKECAHLLSALDGLRSLQRDLREAHDR